MMSKVNDIYQELCSIAVNKSLQAASDGQGFFSRHHDDLYVKDRDTLENYTKGGASMVWVLKSNGAGTALLFTGTDYSEHAISLQSDDSLFYLIHCDGRNAGSIEPLRGVAEAKEAIRKMPFVYFDPKNKHSDILREIFKLGESEKLPYEIRSLNSEEGDRSLLKMQLLGASDLKVCIIKNNKGVDVGGKGGDWAKPVEYYFKCHTDLAIDLLRRSSALTHFMLETKSGGVCSFKEISEKDFDKGMRLASAPKPKVVAAENGLSA